MTGLQLKNSILQEAIQGRLVPNVLEPGEKTGAELLQNILAERQKKENAEKGKKAKKLTLSTIEEEPWELPEGWCWCKLGDVITLRSGRDLEPDKYNAAQKGIPYITGASNFDKGSIIINRWTQSPVSISEKGDLLITCKGTVGELAFNTLGDIHIARQIMAISAIIVNSKYVKVFLRAKVGDLNAQANGVIPGISREDLLLADFPLPPLSIQKAIVAKIEELLPLVDEYDKAAVELETLNKILPDKLRKSVLQEAIHGNLVPNDIPEGEATALELLLQILQERQDRENKEKGKKAKRLTLSTIEEEPWELPEGWCWSTLGDIVLNRDSERVPLSVDVRSRQLNKQFDYYGPGGAFDKVDGYLFDKRLLLVGEDGANLLTRSKPNAFFAEGKFWVNNHVHVLDSLLPDSVILDYIALRINGMSLADYVTGTAQPKMNQEKMNSILIPLPPLSVQHRIVKKIEELFASINQL